MKSKIKCVLFDMDGTIVDTEPLAAQAIMESFKEWRIDLETSDAAFITGRTWAMAIDFLFSKYKIPVSKGEASSLMMHKYRERFEEDLIIVPGAVEAVNSLAAEFPMALVSGSSRQEISHVLKRLAITERFKFYLGCEDYVQSKPSPEGYLKALKQLGFQGQDAIVFEDSNAGIAAAKAAGARVVAITSTNHHGQKTDLAHASIKNLIGVTPAWVRGKF